MSNFITHNCPTHGGYGHVACIIARSVKDELRGDEPCPACPGTPWALDEGCWYEDDELTLFVKKVRKAANVV